MSERSNYRTVDDFKKEYLNGSRDDEWGGVYGLEMKMLLSNIDKLTAQVEELKKALEEIRRVAPIARPAPIGGLALSYRDAWHECVGIASLALDKYKEGK